MSIHRECDLALRTEEVGSGAWVLRVSPAINLPVGPLRSFSSGSCSLKDKMCH